METNSTDTKKSLAALVSLLPLRRTDNETILSQLLTLSLTHSNSRIVCESGVLQSYRPFEN